MQTKLLLIISVELYPAEAVLISSDKEHFQNSHKVLYS